VTDADLDALVQTMRITAGHTAPVLLMPHEARALVAEVERLRAEVAASEARRLQLLDDAGGLENEVRELRAENERLRANHDGLVTTTMEREEFLCAAVEEENRGRCDDRNAVIKYLRVCGHYEAADAISLCGHPLYLCLPAVYTRP
jgi:predicted nuclease with TOPRIM domain